MLRRSRDDRVIGGVCGGLGRYLGVDPVILRIAFVILLVFGGSGLLLYLLAWIAIPEPREGDVLGPSARRAGVEAREVVGVALVVVGALFLVEAVAPGIFASRYVWPAALIAIGVLVLLQGSRR